MEMEFKRFIQKYRHGMMAFPAILVSTWFYLLERIVLIPAYSIYAQADQQIPFLKVFVIPYVFWYLYVAVPLVYFFFKSRQEFIKLSVFLVVGMAVACLIFTFFPNGQPLRPWVLGKDLLSDVIRQIYVMDTPTNSFPSIHVIFSIAVYASTVHYKGFRHKWIPWVSFVLMVLICVSTVFVKQHSVLDVLAGIAVSVALYQLIYKDRILLNFRTPKI